VHTCKVYGGWFVDTRSEVQPLPRDFTGRTACNLSRCKTLNGAVLPRRHYVGGAKKHRGEGVGVLCVRAACG
jgi:hypothetical protein